MDATIHVSSGNSHAGVIWFQYKDRSAPLSGRIIYLVYPVSYFCLSLPSFSSFLNCHGIHVHIIDLHMSRQGIDYPFLRSQAEAIFTLDQGGKGGWQQVERTSTIDIYNVIRGRWMRNSVKPSALVQSYLFRDILKFSDSFGEEPEPLVASSSYVDQYASNEFSASVPVLGKCRREDFDSNFSVVEKSFEITKNTNVVRDETSSFTGVSWIV